jgi:hypothetical protein
MFKLIGYILLASSVAGLAHLAVHATSQYLTSEKALAAQFAAPAGAAPVDGAFAPQQTTPDPPAALR